jgi:hydrogenase maturation protease
VKGRIICIGNRYVQEDAAGLAVLAELETIQPLPPEIELIEGGLAGLNLLPLLEQGGRVVFVDSVKGFTQPGEIILLDCRDGVPQGDAGHFDHGAGLAYLLAVLPRVCDGELPQEIVLIGLEGQCTGKTIERAARLSLNIAAHGLQDIG